MTQPQRLVVLDVDSTLTRDEGIDLLARFVSAEVAAEVSSITAAAMRGELDFEQSLRARVATLRGVPEALIVDATAQVRLTPGAQELVDALHAEGHLVGAVSGGFHHMVDPLAADLHLDFHRANRLGVENGRLTGQLTGAIIDAAAKRSTLREWARDSSIDMTNTVAVGDGGNDVLMLQEAGIGIAFMAKPIAQEAADVIIETADLRLVLDAMSTAS